MDFIEEKKWDQLWDNALTVNPVWPNIYNHLRGEYEKLSGGNQQSGKVGILCRPIVFIKACNDGYWRRCDEAGEFSGIPEFDLPGFESKIITIFEDVIDFRKIKPWEDDSNENTD